jgi:hypothetical protein
MGLTIRNILNQMLSGNTKLSITNSLNVIVMTENTKDILLFVSGFLVAASILVMWLIIGAL